MFGTKVFSALPPITDILGGRLANYVGAENKAVTPAPAGSAEVRALH